MLNSCISFIFVLRPRATLPARDVYYCNGTAAMLLIVAQVHVDRRGHTSRRAARMWSSSLLLLRPNQSLSLSPPLSPAFLNVLYIYFSPDINVELSRSPVSTHTHTGELMEESLPLELREQEFKEER